MYKITYIIQNWMVNHIKVKKIKKGNIIKELESG